MNYMRIISAKQMADDLREERVGTKESHLYSIIFLVGVIFTVLLAYGFWDAAIVYAPEFLRVADKALLVIGSIASVLLAYYVNKKGDGKRFWYRYIALEVPIAITIGAGSLVVFGLALVSGVMDIEFFGYADLIIFLVFHTLALFMVWKYMTRVASGT